jgi:hypothetical protein
MTYNKQTWKRRCNTMKNFTIALAALATSTILLTAGGVAIASTTAQDAQLLHNNKAAQVTTIGGGVEAVNLADRAHAIAAGDYDLDDLASHIIIENVAAGGEIAAADRAGAVFYGNLFFDEATKGIEVKQDADFDEEATANALTAENVSFDAAHNDISIITK